MYTMSCMDVQWHKMPEVTLSVDNSNIVYWVTGYARWCDSITSSREEDHGHTVYCVPVLYHHTASVLAVWWYLSLFFCSNNYVKQS